jgi:hypothetical protein
MPSLEGFKTWIDYEFFFLKLVIVAAVAFWLGGVVLGFLGDLPLTSTEFVFGLVVVSVVVIVGSVWWAGQYR